MRGVADQDLSGARSLLQPGRDVHGVARHERLSAGRVARDHLAAVHARAGLEPNAPLALELLVQRGKRLAKLDGGAERPDRVILLDRRDPEDRHHGVADELLHRAAVALAHLRHGLPIPGHDAPDRLGLEALAERRRLADVVEEDRDRLAGVGAKIAKPQPHPARRAEDRTRRIDLTAVTARPHEASVWEPPATRHCAAAGREGGFRPRASRGRPRAVPSRP